MAVTTRPGTANDIPQLLPLCREALSGSCYRHLTFDAQRVGTILTRCAERDGAFLAVAERGDVLVGLLAATTGGIWHSPEMRASDLVFYTTNDGRGAGAWLARRYLRWARTQGVALIGLSVSFGGDTQRTHRFLQRLGMTYAGGSYLENRL